MVNRIREILKKYDITSSRLAEQLDVPRSTISHILSERNKPSLEFIQKITERYPEININWLLKGEGTIFGKDKDLFSELEQAPGKQNDITENKQQAFPVQNPADKPQGGQESIDLNLREESDKEKVHQIPDYQNMMHPKNPQKKIVKIITFYADKTFDEYLPASTDI